MVFPPPAMPSPRCPTAPFHTVVRWGLGARGRRVETRSKEIKETKWTILRAMTPLPPDDPLAPAPSPQPLFRGGTSMQTFGLTLMLRNDPAKIESYKDYHQRVWPEVTARLRAVGVREMRIFLRDTQLGRASCRERL